MLVALRTAPGNSAWNCRRLPVSTTFPSTTRGGQRRLGVGFVGMVSVKAFVPEENFTVSGRGEPELANIVQYTRDQNPWASEERTAKLMKLLLAYGTHAKEVICELE